MNIFEKCLYSFLGPNKSVKFITSGETTEMVGCPGQMFSALQLTDPLNCFVNSAVQSHHERFGNSTSTLVAVFVLFYKNIFEVIAKEEVNTCSLICKLNQLLEECLSFVESRTFTFLKGSKYADGPNKEFFTNLNIKLQSLFSSKISVKQNSSMNIKSNVFGISLSKTNVSLNNIFMHSRYFCEKESKEDFDSSSSDENLNISFVTTEDKSLNLNKRHAELESVVKEIIHCCVHSEEDASHLIYQLWIKQLKSKKITCYDDFRFDIDKVHTFLSTSLPTNSTVLSGLIFSISPEMLHLVMRSNSPRRALLINGDVIYNYKSKGYKVSFRYTLIPTLNEMQYSDNIKWLQKIKYILEKLKVNLLLVSGHISSDAMDFFLSANIVAIEDVTTRILRIIAESQKISLETFITDCDEENIVENVVIELLHPECLNLKGKNFGNHVRINIAEFQTAIISSGASAALQLKEHKFWHLAHRVTSCTCSSSKLINGQGQFEKLALDWLNFNFYSDSVTDILAKNILCNVFETFIKLVFNCQLSENFRTNVVDDFLSISEAWRNAFYLARTVIQTNYFVFVGVENTMKEKLFDEFNYVGNL